MLLFYRAFLFIYKNVTSLVALFDDKAKLLIKGQEGLLAKIESAEIAVHNPIWFHCASLGEFEQARQLIDEFKDSGEKVLVTFFSPSGYTIRKDYEHADWVFYLPFDGPTAAKKFIQITKPKVAIFVKYDLWYYYLDALKKKEVPSYLISAIYQQDQIYFKDWIGTLHREMLSMFDHIYVQDHYSEKLLNDIDISNASVVGDTRVDSVLTRANGAERIEIIEQFLKGNKAIILGSAYIKEVQMLANEIRGMDGEKIIIAPHNINEKNIVDIKNILDGNCVLYSELYDGKEYKEDVLIIDNIGMLFNCYQYGKWAFIGGGFGSGLHNTLEPAAFNLPVCFGPNYKKFAEAKQMVERKLAKVIQDSSDLKALYLNMNMSDKRVEIAKGMKILMEESTGATEKIKTQISEKIHS